MKKILLTFSVLLLFIFAKSQRLHLTVFGGMSNYQGDLQKKPFTFQQAGAAFGLGGLYEITEKLYLRGNATIGKIKADDKISGDPNRNLNFTSALYEVHLGLEYDILNNYESSLTPFVFAGVSAFHFNPYTTDSLGRRFYLEGLGTEGQGFYRGRTKYALNQWAIPFGGGIKLALTENIRVRIELGLRKTFTDYLDDVSTTYADEAQLILNNGPRAAQFAFRGDEDKIGLTYPPDNSIRGNPKSKDWYYFTGIGISFRLFGSVGDRRGSSRGKTGCPVNIY